MKLRYLVEMESLCAGTNPHMAGKGLLDQIKRIYGPTSDDGALAKNIKVTTLNPHCNVGLGRPSCNCLNCCQFHKGAQP